METVDRIFDLLDRWRHCPDYQLERRADIFFAAYLPDVLSHRFGQTLRWALIPEFPLRIGRFDADRPESNQSCKVDYLAVSGDLTAALLIELKTDVRSVRTPQNDLTRAAARLPLQTLLRDVRQIARASTHKGKYCHLLQILQEQRLLSLPLGFGDMLKNKATLREVDLLLEKVEFPDVRPQVQQAIFIVPNANADEPGQIGFAEIAARLRERLDDPVAARFAKSLGEWAREAAGSHAAGDDDATAPCR